MMKRAGCAHMRDGDEVGKSAWLVFGLARPVNRGASDVSGWGVAKDDFDRPVQPQAKLLGLSISCRASCVAFQYLH